MSEQIKYSDLRATELIPDAVTLRDWFAGMALQGIHASCTQGFPDPDVVAEKAYKQADEMIARRTKP